MRKFYSADKIRAQVLLTNQEVSFSRQNKHPKIRNGIERHLHFCCWFVNILGQTRLSFWLAPMIGLYTQEVQTLTLVMEPSGLVYPLGPLMLAIQFGRVVSVLIFIKDVISFYFTPIWFWDQPLTAKKTKHILPKANWLFLCLLNAQIIIMRVQRVIRAKRPPPRAKLFLGSILLRDWFPSGKAVKIWNA